MFCINCGQENSDEANFCRHCGQRLVPRGQQQEDKKEKNSKFSIEEYEKRRRRNKKIGLWLVIAPIAALFLILSAYAIAQFVFSAIEGPSELSTTTASIINVVMGLIGMIAVIGIIFGIPIGIIYLMKRDHLPGVKIDNRSGKGASSEIPQEIRGWNWGAAGLTWIWGAAHRVWISFLAFIPLVNIVIFIYLGLKGSELAWRADKWTSVESFLKTQRKWKPWGIFFFTISVIGAIVNAVLSIISET